MATSCLVLLSIMIAIRAFYYSLWALILKSKERFQHIFEDDQSRHDDDHALYKEDQWLSEWIAITSVSGNYFYNGFYLTEEAFKWLKINQNTITQISLFHFSWFHEDQRIYIVDWLYQYAMYNDETKGCVYPPLMSCNNPNLNLNEASLTWPSQASSVATNTYSLLSKQSSFLPGGSLLNSKFPQRLPSKPIHSLSVSATTKIKPVESSDLKTHISNLEKLLAEPSHDQEQIQEQKPIEKTNSKNKYKRLLEALNLSRMWPEMMKQEVEENLSPKQFQRLISPSPKYSPRNNLASRWPEYHGSNDWVGLLDPLDENLRREIVRYGEFIQAAYLAFHSDPATPTDKAPILRHVTLPDRSYKVTKSLYATSSVGLPPWFDDVIPDLGWMTQRSSWIGYVAVCDDQKEIKRMGRRDIVIALRGTSTCLEWAENVRDLLISVNETEESPPSELSQERLQAKVECGFWSLYKTRGTHIPSLSESITREVQRLMELYKGEPLSITITGHSLGAALSVLAADEIKKSIADAPPVAVFTFGGPRVGNRGFANRVKSNGVKVLRIVNSQDMITRVPGMFVNETLDYKLREEVKANTMLNILDNNMPWAYSHVGSELRLDSKMSPYLKPNADVACCHDLEAYLHLVDGFLASDCPFRSNAKRSLFKLLHEQGSNVKKLYVNTAKSLQELNLEHSNNKKGN